MKRKSFTLIELLIVVAIIGILSAVAVPQLINARTKAKLAGVYGAMKTIQTAIAAYRLDHTHPPIDMGPDAQDGITYLALTTPVPYVTSIDVFRDPFKTHAEEDMGIYYAYGSAYHISRFDDIERINLFQQNNVSYFLFGWGPDRQPNWPWALLGETLSMLNEPSKTGPNRDGGIFYSITNGLISQGDIVSTDSRIFQ